MLMSQSYKMFSKHPNANNLFFITLTFVVATTTTPFYQWYFFEISIKQHIELAKQRIFKKLKYVNVTILNTNNYILKMSDSARLTNSRMSDETRYLARFARWVQDLLT